MAKVEKIIGIDVSKKTFCAATESERAVKTHSWDYTDEGMESFASTVDRESIIVMEATGVYHTRLATFLYNRGLKVSVQNPLSVKNYARMCMKRTKTDKSDAKLILDYGKMFGEELDLWKPKPDWCIEVQQLYSMLEYKHTQLTMAKNKMESLSNSHHVSKACAEMCLADITSLSESIEAIEKEIDRLVMDNDSNNLDRLEGIPGIGRKTACLLLALLGSMQGFDNYRQVISYLGMCPRVYESGTSVHGRARICKMGLGSIRKKLYMCALSARKCNPACKALYDRLVEKGKASKLALIAVANKLLKQAFAILKNQTTFDENHVSEKIIQKNLAW